MAPLFLYFNKRTFLGFRQNLFEPVDVDVLRLEQDLVR